MLYDLQTRNMENIIIIEGEITRNDTILNSI